MIRSLGAFVVFSVISAPVGALAEEPFRLRLAWDVGFEEGDDIEKGFVHPKAMKLHVGKLLSQNLGVFAYSQVGKSAGESFGGILIRPFAGVNCGELCDGSFILDMELGAGLGVGGIPIVGGSIRIEAKEALLLYTIAHYQYLTGWDQDIVFRFRLLPTDKWFVELWSGVMVRISGEFDMLGQSIEAGVPIAIVVRRPVYGILWVMWPWRIRQYRAGIDEIILGLELEF